MRKFDFVIGNPPYQEETSEENENKTFAPPVYDKFLDAAFKVSDKVEMIHPARFLSNSGSTSKAWNQKMLNDEHFKVLFYEENAKIIFPNTQIKGGIVISYHDNTRKFGAIEVFPKYSELLPILYKVIGIAGFESMERIVITRTAFRLTDLLHKDHPEAIQQLSKGHAYDMSTNIFDRLPQVFFDSQPDDNHKYIRILGRKNNRRVIKYIRRDYVNNVVNLDKYKVYLSKANGNGDFGETFSNLELSEPGMGATESFISIGVFDSVNEAENTCKYVKTKFARALLGILKTTQDITPEKWKFVPLQDFTEKSDIDWSKPVSEIDQQLYKKYNLTQEEIDFIETHVKEMA